MSGREERCGAGPGSSLDIAALFLFDLPSRDCETEHTIHNCIFCKSIFNACIQHARYTRGEGAWQVERARRGRRGWWVDFGNWQLASQLALHLPHATLTAAARLLPHTLTNTHTLAHTHPCVSQAMQIGDCIKNGGNFSNYFKWQFVSNARAAVAKIQFQFCFWVHFSNLISIFGHRNREKTGVEHREQSAKSRETRALSRITLLANFQRNHI